MPSCMNGPTVERITSLRCRSRARSAVEVTSTSATGRSASKRSASASILLRLRPTNVGSSPRASSSRSTRCPVYPVAPSNTILRFSVGIGSARLEDHDRELAVGARDIRLEGGIGLEEAWPQVGGLGTRRLARADTATATADVDFNVVGVRAEVVVPGRVLGAAEQRGDDDEVLAVAHVDRRALPARAGLRTGVMQDEQGGAVEGAQQAAAGGLEDASIHPGHGRVELPPQGAGLGCSDRRGDPA